MNFEYQKKCVFLSWERHRRSRSISREMKIPIFEVVYDTFFLKRYILSMIDTFKILKKERPDVVIYQNPSIVLALCIFVYSLFNKLSVIMDAHNAAIFPLEGRFWLLNKLCKMLVSKVDLTIVTNSMIAQVVREGNGRPFVLEDPIPELDVSEGVTPSKGEDKSAAFICSWAKDEPYMEVLEAFKNLRDENIKLYVTGRPPEHITRKPIPDNVKLTGFLSDRDYIDLLASSNLIIDLTNRADCLVCGAYEAAAVGTPCIISSNLCSVETFNKGYLYSNNDSVSLSKSIVYAIEKEKKLRVDMKEFRREYIFRNSKKIESLKSVILSI